MSTITEIFRDARLSTVPTAPNGHPRYTGYFGGLNVGGIDHHGQVNIAQAHAYGRPWVVSIYILVTASNRGVVTSFQARAKTHIEAIEQVERLTEDWAQTRVGSEAVEA